MQITRRITKRILLRPVRITLLQSICHEGKANPEVEMINGTLETAGGMKLIERLTSRRYNKRNTQQLEMRSRNNSKARDPKFIGTTQQLETCGSQNNSTVGSTNRSSQSSSRYCNSAGRTKTLEVTRSTKGSAANSTFSYHQTAHGQINPPRAQAIPWKLNNISTTENLGIHPVAPS
ncbi:hypothetical protein F511_25514 [Dorcoceras hygrometricum]|uniref:Uncharacterized protein n=1 Tax=Dorcoceras hygrometricum TaxID=472368 RepID=A0A2Z7D954_9LAMI|nr:hypothetical protein F511_25514 [Dorcoceras hygrometricum]